jgi:hypothetical protein
MLGAANMIILSFMYLYFLVFFLKNGYIKKLKIESPGPSILFEKGYLFLNLFEKSNILMIRTLVMEKKL